ncbi:MAG: hypothetical protein MUF48_23070 [Pirellulaceae bacterium]|nr:hypothetical protein [Pirellulaceae bacterium]
MDIPVKTTTRRTLQIRREVEIVVRGNKRYVSEIRREMRQSALYIHPLLIAARQRRDGKAVPHIMETRGPSALVQDIGRETQLVPGVGQGWCAVRTLVRDRIVAPQQGSVRFQSVSIGLTALQATEDFPRHRAMEGNDAGCVKLGGHDVQQIVVPVDISYAQPEQFTSAQATAEEQHECQADRGGAQGILM